MKNIFIIILFIVSQYSNIRAEDFVLKKHYIGIFPSLTLHDFRDDQASPLRYHGQSFPLRLRYSYLGKRNRHVFEIQYNRYILKSSIKHKAEFFGGELSYSYLRFNRMILNEKIRLFFGVKLNTIFSGRILTYHISQEPFFHILSSIEGKVMGKHLISKSREIQYSVSVPVATYVVRSRYAYVFPDGFVNEVNNDYSSVNSIVKHMLKNGDFVFMNKFRGISASVSYREAFTKHLVLIAGYDFTYYQYSEPRMLRMAGNQVSLTINWMF